MKHIFLNAKKTIRGAKVGLFFNARGEQLERSTESLYCSLIFQLIQGNPELQTCLGELGFDIYRTVKTNGWQLQVLKDVLAKAIEKLGESLSYAPLIHSTSSLRKKYETWSIS